MKSRTGEVSDFQQTLCNGDFGDTGHDNPLRSVAMACNPNAVASAEAAWYYCVRSALPQKDKCSYGR